ncbi:MAG: NADP-dependent phosphogluconate dehydrogenase [Deltaproteobacteria bacterium]|nr:NADP-dependent phosphogluconate dehydrogenase [Deltaproteobacteria bacterium]
MNESTCDLGLIGLAVMGQNLVLNIERRGFVVAVFNRTKEKTQQFISGPAAGKQIIPAYQLEEFVRSLKRPRQILVMVKAGSAVDKVIEKLAPLMEPGDAIFDCGNSHFKDTERRSQELTTWQIEFMGVGVSGGEEGALWGPSIMPGGSPAAWPGIQPVLEKAAAVVERQPCVAYFGSGGSGHFVKMVHNGIEYGDMQLIAEAYDLLQRGFGFSAAQLGDVFKKYNQGPLASYLIEITADIFGQKDQESGRPLVDLILDKAGQKGTGRWTCQTALEMGIPIPTIQSAVESRMLSSQKTFREQAAKLVERPAKLEPADKNEVVEAVEAALYASKVCSYAQGFAMLQATGSEYGYQLDLGEIARIWRGGCIIRANLLQDIRAAYEQDTDLAHLFLAPFFSQALTRRLTAWRQAVNLAINRGIPVPAMSASLAYFDSCSSERLPANLLQAQRDYFGAHTYQRIDKEGSFHTPWKKTK